MALLGEFLLGFASGEAYIAAASVLTVLVIGQTVNGLAGSEALLLNFMHDEKFVLETLLVSLGFSVILDLVLIPVYGAWEVAISNAVAIGTWNAILIARALVKHAVNPTFTALALHT